MMMMMMIKVRLIEWIEKKKGDLLVWKISKQENLRKIYEDKEKIKKTTLA